MKANRPRVLALDLDGVISDTFEIHITGWLVVMKLLGLPEDRMLCEDLRGVPTLEAIESIAKRCCVKVSSRELEFLARVKNACRDFLICQLSPVDLCPGVLELVTEAKQVGAQVICIATTTAAKRILEHLGFRASFDRIVSGLKSHEAKAASSVALVDVLRSLGVKRSDCLYIEDSPAAACTAIAEGIPTLLLIKDAGVIQPQSSCELSSIGGLQNQSLCELYRLARRSMRRFRGTTEL